MSSRALEFPVLLLNVKASSSLLEEVVALGNLDVEEDDDSGSEVPSVRCISAELSKVTSLEIVDGFSVRNGPVETGSDNGTSLPLYTIEYDLLKT